MLHKPIIINNDDEPDSREVPAYKIRCQRCGRYGHLRPECDTEMYPDFPDAQCRHCLKVGHVTMDCLEPACSHCSHVGHIIDDCPELDQDQE